MPRILQLTDLHIFATAGREHYGLDTFVTFDQVLSSALTLSTPDLILLTGDLCQDESIEGYQRLQSRLARLPCPVLALPGNHDNIAFMQQHLVGDNIQVLGDQFVGHWRVVAANCAVPGKVHGEFGENRLNELDQLLSEGADTPTLLSFHQPPVKCGSAWLDQSRLQDADQLATLLARHPQVRSLVCGHIHQQLETTIRTGNRDTPVLTTPSTCKQFAVKHDAFKLSEEAPGWRWIDLGDVEITSTVHRIAI
ncbi:MAG: phosphodiesterase [Woeseiaceae bacterium]